MFVRFSTVAGGAGSGDTPRDVRGFAVKFYTEEGNFDLVGNNIPVFFIQDAIKFPDLVHSVKMEPDRGFPQAASAHDTFWDFVSLMPESMHMLHVGDVGSHDPALVPDDGRLRRPHLPARRRRRQIDVREVPLAADDRLAVADLGRGGEDQRRRSRLPAPRSVRRDRRRRLSRVRVRRSRRSTRRRRRQFPFDILDATKLIPEEIVPLEPIGRMVLDRNPDNFFAETEQVAFHPGHVVPGIDFTNDPLLQGRLFSYTDTQLIRLGGPNFHEIPDQPRRSARCTTSSATACAAWTCTKGQVAYEPNSLAPDGPREDRGSAASASFADGSRRRRQGARALGDLRRSLQPGAAVLALDDRARAAPHRQRLHLRAEQGRDGRDPPAHARPPREHRRRAAASASRQGSAWKGRPRRIQPARPPIDMKPSPALSLIAKAPKTLEGRKVGVLVTDGTDAALVAALRGGGREGRRALQVVAPKIGGATGEGRQADRRRSSARRRPVDLLRRRRRRAVGRRARRCSRGRPRRSTGCATRSVTSR